MFNTTIENFTNFLTEERIKDNLFKDLTFDEFCKALDYYCGKVSEEEKMSITPILQKLNKVSLSRSPFTYFLKRFCERNKEMSEQCKKELYSVVMTLNTNKIEKCLGIGSDGIVFVCGNFIIKLFYKPISEQYKIFLENCKENDYSTLPKIYRVGVQYYVMESLEMETENCEYIYESMKTCFNFSKLLYKLDTGEYEEDEDRNMTDDDEIEDIDTITDPFVIDWCEQFISEAKDSGLYKYIKQDWNLLDFHLGNLGERDNGDIVFFDPIYTKVAQQNI